MSQNYSDDCYSSGMQAATGFQAFEDNFAALKSAFSGVSTPSNLVPGMMWLDTTLSLLKTRNEANDAWNIVCRIVATGITSGDLVYASAANVLSLLAKGTAYQSLNMNAGATAPQWMASLQSILTTTGDLIYASAARTPARLAIGVVGNALRVNSLANGVEWGAGSWYQVSRGEQETSSATYVKLKAIYCPVAGAYEVYFEYKLLTGVVAFARIYVDDEAVGTERILYDDYVGFYETITVTVGQHIQIYGRMGRCRNFTVQLLDATMTIA